MAASQIPLDPKNFSSRKENLMQARTIERNIKSVKLNLKWILAGIPKNKCLKLQEMLIQVSDTTETEGPKENDRLFQLLKGLRIYQKSTESLDFLFHFATVFAGLCCRQILDAYYLLVTETLCISYEINKHCEFNCMCQVRRQKG